jgi:hypothetical protein
MDYWIFVDYNTKERKEKVDKAIEILQDLDFQMPVLDSKKRVIAFLAESSHTDISLEGTPKIKFKSTIIINETWKIKKVSEILEDLGFDTELSVLERENKSKFTMKIQEESIGSGIKWSKIDNKTSTKA